MLASTITNTTTYWCAITACGTNNPELGAGGLLVAMVLLIGIMVWLKVTG